MISLFYKGLSRYSFSGLSKIFTHDIHHVVILSVKNLDLQVFRLFYKIGVKIAC